VDDSDFLHEVLNLYEVNNGDEPVNYSNGKNAKFVLNGLETERKANVFTISGVEYTIKAVTDNAVTVSSVSDTDAIFDKIKGFVDKYNELLGFVNEKLMERRYRDFPPLTNEQRRAMDDKEIEMWEEKAKSGLLRGDHMLSGILTDMRMLISDQVKGLGDGRISSLAQIGITTG
ncbi:flagellar filament capping protein FliD, partial [Desulfuribacillus alkaliarsenatis]|uniref:flagellar filament capping protein FliD n=1 Tax=Desulfuribacillus alkaliarsenatis TaxID=766136 RepID=UPI00159F2C1F